MRKLLFAFCIAVSFISCSSIKPIEFRSVDNFTVSKLSLNPEISAEVKLYNPNVAGAKLKDFRMNLYIRNDSLTSIYLPDVVHAGARKEFSIPFSTAVSVIQLSQMIPQELENWKSGKAIPVRMNGTVTVKKFIFKKTFPLSFSGEVR